MTIKNSQIKRKIAKGVINLKKMTIIKGSEFLHVNAIGVVEKQKG